MTPDMSTNTPPPPARFGRYQVIRLLGTGGMADVYLARDLDLDRDVAVKAPRVEQLDARSLERFKSEAKAVARLTHPAIVALYAYGEQDGRPYLVMPYLSGGSLADRLGRGRLALPGALPIIERLAAALDHAHAHGVIHRDVKPANVLFDSVDQAHLSDFGIARVLLNDESTAQHLTPAGLVIGTAAYVSPEQVSAQEIGPPSDIYSLGVVVFEMLTGRVPYDAPSTVLRAAQHVTAPIPSACVLRRDLPATLDEIITQALAKHPADRYPTATALAAALRDIATRQDSPPVRVAEPALRVEVPRLRRRADRPLRVEVPPESPRPRPLKVSVPNPPPRPRRLTRWQLLLILLGLLALALGVAVGFWLEM